MKNIILFLFLFPGIHVTAQQNSITLTVKDTAGKILAGQIVSVIAEYQGMPSYKEPYSETFRLKTNTKGQVKLVPGKGTKKTGSYAKVQQLARKEQVWIYIRRVVDEMPEEKWLDVYILDSKAGLHPAPRFVSEAEVGNQ